ncbi:FAS1-like dehydratase domain-containing protein [Parasphingopyxis marina]|uniref:MaoC family dehydratase N-terminal domain-containing protein n=1 Tax=Parasphingopyxis marina TaxID=2761622 RepID=A0A842I160_9SPHN|nr:MaoC family dehydratase N-terminal domain-containing protein [Parasphingopyxis marina]MBC2778962.1 MaoC family dehydratase N-terminal domain-containing protein [Parasphingopyxis marina]
MSDLPQKVKDWLGKPVIVVDHVVTVEQGLWTNFCVAVKDGNPLYWDYSVSREETETVIAPPTMLPSWAIEHEWMPGREGPALRTLELHFMVKDALGLKNGLVTEVELELHDPLRAGDSVRAEQILRSVGEERETRLGLGRDWEIDVVYRKPDGSLAGVQTLHLLGYGKVAA